MPTVVLASAIARWLTPVPTTVGERKLTISGSTVREVLDGLFAEFPQIRGYLIDDHAVLRHHVVVFVNSEAVTDKRTLGDPVPTDGEVYVFQALSGG